MATDDMHGLATASVLDNTDPTQQGRLLIQFAGGSDGIWASVVGTAAATPAPIGSSALVGFENGDSDHPFVIGTLAGATASQPAMATMTTVSGLSVRLDDSTQTLSLTTPGGALITLSDVGDAVRIADASGNVAVFDGTGISLTASGTVTISAASVHIAAASVQVDAATTNFSGVIQCDTLIANSVVSASYTPGAGNLQ